MPNRSVTGKVIVVLGGAGGIGAATAVAAARSGAHVAIGDVTPSSLSETFPEAVTAAYVDVADEGSLTEFREHLLGAFGHVDALVNCAAVIEPGTIESSSVAGMKRQFDVNAFGTVLATKVFLPPFLARRAGHFIHLSSLGGIVPLPHEAVYSATKFAVRGFCLAAAEELRGTGVAITVVCPDSTDTVQLHGEASSGGTPLSFVSRPLQPDAVAAAILQAIRRPRREVCVPAARGAPAKLAGAFPLVFRAGYPLLRDIGMRRRGRFLASLQRTKVGGELPEYREVSS